MPEFTVKRRTFGALSFPKGSEERAKMNLNGLTSEYMVSYKYAVTTETDYVNSYRTKWEATRAANEFNTGKAIFIGKLG